MMLSRAGGTDFPKISYVLEYKPAEIQDSEIIKMAESAKERD